MTTEEQGLARIAALSDEARAADRERARALRARTQLAHRLQAGGTSWAALGRAAGVSFVTIRAQVLAYREARS